MFAQKLPVDNNKTNDKKQVTNIRFLPSELLMFKIRIA